MRARTLLVSALIGAALAPATLASPPPPSSPLRGRECLDPSQARGFVHLDHRLLLVDSGRYRYRISVTPGCRALDYASVIGFRGDPMFHRVCGSHFDAVLVRGQPPCRIERMEIISKAQYKLALKQQEDQRRARRAERRARSNN